MAIGCQFLARLGQLAYPVSRVTLRGRPGVLRSLVGYECNLLQPVHVAAAPRAPRILGWKGSFCKEKKYVQNENLKNGSLTRTLNRLNWN